MRGNTVRAGCDLNDLGDFALGRRSLGGGVADGFGGGRDGVDAFEIFNAGAGLKRGGGTERDEESGNDIAKSFHGESWLFF